MPQFNPLNERLKKQYEETLLHGKHLQERTVLGVWKAITQFEMATGRIALDTVKAEHAKTFKSWLDKQKTEKGEPLSLATQRSMLAAVREFFMWLRLHPKHGRKVDARVAEYLHLSKNNDRAARASQPRPVPTVAQMRQAVAAMPSQTVWERRDRAVMALVAITGVRDAALISLRLGDVNVAERSMWQNPRHVHTKFRKGITTAFVPVAPELETIVLEWVAYLQAQGYGPHNPLFPMDDVQPNPDTLVFEVVGLAAKGWNSAARVRQIFKEAFTREVLTKSWTDWIDYWSVDFDYASKKEIIRVQRQTELAGMEHPQGTLPEYEDIWTGDFIFENEWQSFRTKKERKLELTSVAKECPAGPRKIAVKVVDIFGNDTMKVLDVVIGGK